MPKFIIGLFAAALFTAVCAGPVSAGTPLDPGGSVTGFIPVSQGAVKCSRYMNKRVTVAANCVLKCHLKRNGAILLGKIYDDDVCEDICKAKYDKSLGLLDQTLCPVCLNSTTQFSLYGTFHDWEETLNGLFYCDNSNSVPFGVDDTGSGSLNHDISKCEDAFAKNADKLIKCIQLKCHRNLAEKLFFDNGGPLFNVAACESTDPTHSCRARFLEDTAKITGCPACLDAAHMAQGATVIQQALDSMNGLMYCE